MRIRHAAVMSGLALGVMSGAARAAEVSYDISIPFGSATITGTLVTDGAAGYLDQNDIVRYDFRLAGYNDVMGENAVTFFYGTNGLKAIGTALSFNFDSDQNIVFQNSQQLSYVEASGSQSNTGSSLVDYYDNGDEVGPMRGYSGTYVIGMSAVDVGGVSAVPLPAAAPMFGAALVALGAVGYGLKRKASAA